MDLIFIKYWRLLDYSCKKLDTLIWRDRSYRTKQHRGNTNCPALLWVEYDRCISTDNRVCVSWHLPSDLYLATACRRVLLADLFSRTSCQNNSSERVINYLPTSRRKYKILSYFMCRFVRYWCVTAYQVVLGTDGFHCGTRAFPVRESICCIFFHRYVRFRIILGRKFARKKFHENFMEIN